MVTYSNTLKYFMIRSMCAACVNRQRHSLVLRKRNLGVETELLAVSKLATNAVGKVCLLVLSMA